MNIIVANYEQLLTDIRQIVKEELSRQKPKAPENDLVDISEAMVLTGYQKATIYIKVSRNEIPFVKVGRKVRFSRKALAQWIKDQN